MMKYLRNHPLSIQHQLTSMMPKRKKKNTKWRNNLHIPIHLKQDKTKKSWQDLKGSIQLKPVNLEESKDDLQNQNGLMTDKHLTFSYWVLRIFLCYHYKLRKSIDSKAIAYPFHYPNDIKWLPCKWGLEGSDVRNFNFVSDDKKVVSSRPLVANIIRNFP